MKLSISAVFKIKLLAVAFGLPLLKADAQWLTQSIELKPGWNAVYLHVDPSYTEIGDLQGLSDDIEEIWLWQPKLSTGQFIQDPEKPTDKKSRWKSWLKKLGPSSKLQNMIGNAGYLVRYGNPDEKGNWSPDSNYTWKIKGRPVPPSYEWTSSGLNLIGVSSHPATPPSIEEYFPQSILSSLEFFGYDGGALGEENPSQVFQLRSTKVNRGEAFWIRSDDKFNNYFAPFDLVLQQYNGVDFGENSGQFRIIIRNRTDDGLTVSLDLKATESAPNDQQAFRRGMNVLVRGEPNPIDLSYSYKSLVDDTKTWALKPAGKPGSSIEVILGLDRTVLKGKSGTKYGSILEFTDSLGHAAVHLPVSATKASSGGLWVGDAKVEEVRDDIGFRADYPDSSGLVVTDEERKAFYAKKLEYDPVPNPYSLRLIMHQEPDKAESGLKLYQRLYHGLQKGAELTSETILAADVSSLESSQLASARRISAVHLPWKAKNTPWECKGLIKAGSKVNVAISLAHNDHSSNPFLHTYHPDHDNLDPRFKNEEVQGKESFGIKRDITLKLNEPPNSFDGLTSTQRRIRGSFMEIITIAGSGTEKKQYFSRGSFTLNKISAYKKVHVVGE
jgi:hypothetical protein